MISFSRGWQRALNSLTEVVIAETDRDLVDLARHEIAHSERGLVRFGPLEDIDGTNQTAPGSE